MFENLEQINTKPEPFEYYTAADLWTDEHTSGQMLKFHLDDSIDLSSRNSAFIDKSVEWIASEFGISPNTSIIDFGCGPGLYTTRFAQRGAEVTGIDFSNRSIEYARSSAARQNFNIEYICRNYLDYRTDKKFDLITMIFCDFCALSPSQRRTLLSIFASILKDTGRILLDVYSLNLFHRKNETAFYELNQFDGFWSPDKYYAFVNSFKYDDEKVILDKYTIIEQSRQRTVYNWLQCFSPESIEREFQRSGLKIDALYSDVAGTKYAPSSPDIALVAGKP